MESKRYHYITYSSRDAYSPYMNIGLTNPNQNNLCGGWFGKHLKESFKIEKLPYNIKLIDLILENDNTDELFIKLPKEYFTRWTRYPYIPRDSIENEEEHIKNAIFNSFHIDSSKSTKLEELLHPYDSELKDKFCKKYSVEHPKELVINTHPNGEKFFPYESYLSSWRAYVIFETTTSLKFISKYLNKDKGVNKFKSIYKEVNDYWLERYSKTFNRLITFKSFISQHHSFNIKIKKTYGDLSKFILNFHKSTKDDLISDMYLLLEIYYNWTQKYKKDGIIDYELGLKVLKKDIYLLSQWLNIEKINEEEMFELYSNNNSQMAFKTEIKEILDYEEIKFKEHFDKYTPFYTKNISKWLLNNNVNNIYINLEKLSSFYPWMRAFYDLHTFLNKKGELRLIQPRTLDYLLILTIRTEILIREIYEKRSSALNISSFSKVIRKLDQYFNNKVLETVSNNIKLTRLDNEENIKPQNIFLEVENFNVGRSWSKENKYFFKEIMKFITSRNYFAHNCYKDDEINETGELSNEVLVACLHSVLYIGSVL